MVIPPKKATPTQSLVVLIFHTIFLHFKFNFILNENLLIFLRGLWTKNYTFCMEEWISLFHFRLLLFSEFNLNGGRGWVYFWGGWQFSDGNWKWNFELNNFFSRGEDWFFREDYRWNFEILSIIDSRKEMGGCEPFLPFLKPSINSV